MDEANLGVARGDIEASSAASHKSMKGVAMYRGGMEEAMGPGHRSPNFARRCCAAVLAAVLAIGVVEAAAAAVPLDLNRASVEELAELPGIGPARAEAIVSRREAVPFERVEELLAIRGIGDAVFARLRERVHVVRPVGPEPEKEVAGHLPEALR